MASITGHPAPAAPRDGFVMAMRAEVTTAKAPAWHEWIIVSRWGATGQYLSVGRTRIPALSGETAPIDLTPRLTALARLLRLPPDPGPSTFLFMQRRPLPVSVAGHFAPAHGYVRFDSLGAVQRLQAEGRCAADATRAAWRVEAVRVAWIGEFIEGAAAGES